MAKFTRVFGIPKLPVHWTRGLRFRLTLSYVLFFTVLLVVIGLFFRRTIQSQLEGSVREALEEEWGEAKGYLKIEEYRPVWIADPTDPEEAYIVSRIKHVFYIADANGVAIDYDETYASIGLDSPAEIARILEGEPVVHIRYDKSAGAEPAILSCGARDDRARGSARMDTSRARDPSCQFGLAGGARDYGIESFDADPAAQRRR